MAKRQPTASYFEKLMADWHNRQLPVDMAMAETTQPRDTYLEYELRHYTNNARFE